MLYISSIYSPQTKQKSGTLIQMCNLSRTDEPTRWDPVMKTGPLPDVR